MIKEEFENLTGFEVSPEEYTEIEAEYMDTGIDKAMFTANWKKAGGIERISRLRIEKIKELSEKLRRLESNYAAVNERIDRKDKGRMEKYVKALESLSIQYGSDWIKPATNAVIEVALQDYLHDGITDDDYSKICHDATRLMYSKQKSS